MHHVAATCVRTCVPCVLALGRTHPLLLVRYATHEYTRLLRLSSRMIDKSHSRSISRHTRQPVLAGRHASCCRQHEKAIFHNREVPKSRDRINREIIDATSAIDSGESAGITNGKFCNCNFFGESLMRNESCVNRPSVGSYMSSLYYHALLFARILVVILR